ncbi:transcriptional regulator with XRE-family HTH domain [Micromonospora carbonacea subsp. aurantiaca]|uniref:Helix-turn-helix domain-containing protein n=1 Tax=Micromonospora carbonacea TaxID=47853 RepID=A0A7H8XS26_9ACTN|nr:transcriptional regulator with XRE-family HTH domain [Micromonospora carbonacea]QLD26581.1 helix-turn-helix domain-containing protein [Micromonospora carbonacea]
MRQLRRREELTLEQVCDRLGWASTSKLSRIELGQSRPDLADVLDLLDVYRVGPDERDALIVIARDAATGRGWWKTLGGMGERQRAYAELEAGAATVVEYQPAVVPGLLQTPAYARLRLGVARLLHPEVDVEADVRARLVRQEVLHRPEPPRYTALLELAACDPGGVPDGIWREQLRHLVHLAGRPNVTIRVVPPGATAGGAHPLTPFTRYSFPDPADPRTVMLEALTTDVRLVSPADLGWYDAVIDRLLDAALPAAETAALLGRLADDPSLPAAVDLGGQPSVRSRPEGAALPRPRQPQD